MMIFYFTGGNSEQIFAFLYILPMQCILTTEKLEDENFMDDKIITIQYTQNLHPYYLHIYYSIIFMHGRNLGAL